MELGGGGDGVAQCGSDDTCVCRWSWVVVGMVWPSMTPMTALSLPRCQTALPMVKLCEWERATLMCVSLFFKLFCHICDRMRCTSSFLVMSESLQVVSFLRLLYTEN